MFLITIDRFIFAKINIKPICKIATKSCSMYLTFASVSMVIYVSINAFAIIQRVIQDIYDCVVIMNDTVISRVWSSC